MEKIRINRKDVKKRQSPWSETRCAPPHLTREVERSSHRQPNQTHKRREENENRRNKNMTFNNYSFGVKSRIDFRRNKLRRTRRVGKQFEV
jgi:hypothetical protein